jgi:glycerophosphoryl diester phosphodiesterase
MPSDRAHVLPPRAARACAFAAALLLGLCGACEPRGPVLHPKFPNGGDLANASPVPVDALPKLEGMYQVARGGTRFGGTVAVHASRGALSIFSNWHDNYAILAAGCLAGGTVLELEGYWRYASESDTGLIRLTVAPPALALALCTGAPVPTTAGPAQLTGGTGENNGAIHEGSSFRFAKALLPTAGRFWVAAHHGACATVDDCGTSENSLPSLLQVEAFGASDVEVDVRMTADGVPILFHDDNFGPRLANGVYCHGAVKDFTLADARARCQLKFGEDIPTLDEALAAVVKSTTLSAIWLDLKVPGAVQPALDASAKYRALATQLGRKIEIIFGLGDRDVLAAYRAANVPAGTKCLVELDPSDVRGAGCQFWGPRWTRGPVVDDVRSLQLEGRAVMFWTIDEAAYVDLYLKQARPNGILTDRPGMVFHRFQTLGVYPRDPLP